jgi:Cupin domain
MRVRQVVTGHNAKGRSVFARDEYVDAMPIPNLGELALLWSANEPATYPNAGDNPEAPGVFPPLGGVRLVMATYSLEFEVVAPEPLPGMYVEDGGEDGFHRTDTTDFGVLISGKLALELDDGAEVLLSPGDVVVQSGTRHRWRVVGDAPATMAAFIIGAHHR